MTFQVYPTDVTMMPLKSIKQMPLHAMFISLWQRLGGTDAVKTYCEISSEYSRDTIFYHGLSHIRFSLNEFKKIMDRLDDPDAVELAIWFHDIIYDTRRKDNEEKSAEYAGRAIRKAGLSAALAKKVSRLILATKHHGRIVKGSDAGYLVDIDLAIFGQSRRTFEWYDKGIREEYRWVKEPEYKKGRSDVFRYFLNRPRIYHTRFFGRLYERQARKNLMRALLLLEEE